MKHAIILTTMLLATGAMAGAQTPGPFGFEKGMRKEQIISIVGKRAVVNSGGDGLIVSTAPNPHPEFENYVLFFSPEGGLHKVIAMGKRIEAGDDGGALREAYDDVVEGVSQKYGKPSKSVDECVAGVECDSEFWMLALSRENRRLNSLWEPLSVGNHVTSIYVVAGSMNLRSGFISVSFEFEGFREYQDKLRAKQNEKF